MLVIVLLVAVLCFSMSKADYNCTNPPLVFNYDIGSCCNAPPIDLGTLQQKCTKEIDAVKNDPNFPAFAHMCYPECMLRESGVLLNGEIQIDGVRTFLLNNMPEPDQDIIAVIIKCFDDCVNNIKGYMNAVKIEKDGNPPNGCSPYPSMIWSCVNVEIYINCPAKMWTNVAECNSTKNFIKQCNPLPHIPLPVH